MQDDLTKYFLGVPLVNHQANIVTEAFTVNFIWKPIFGKFFEVLVRLKSDPKPINNYDYFCELKQGLQVSYKFVREKHDYICILEDILMNIV